VRYRRQLLEALQGRQSLRAPQQPAGQAAPAPALEHGLDDLSVEPSDFMTDLAAQGWTYRQVPPNGNCLFESLQLLIPDRLSRHVPAARRLRDWLADELDDDLRRYREGWGGGAPPRWAQQLDYDYTGVTGQAGETEAIRRQHRRWVRQTRTDGVWNQQIGDLWARMIADLTGPLIVLQPGQPPVRLGADTGEPRYLIRAGNHFTPAWPPGQRPLSSTVQARPLPTEDVQPLPTGDVQPDDSGATPYQVAWLRMVDGRIASLPEWSGATAPGQLLAALAHQAPRRMTTLLGQPAGQDPVSDIRRFRGLVQHLLLTDLTDRTLNDSRYANFIEWGERNEVADRLLTADTWDENTAALALMIAADLVERPIAVTGTDDASSAWYGQEHGGTPIQLILQPGGQGRYLPVQLLGPPRRRRAITYNSVGGSSAPDPQARAAQVLARVNEFLARAEMDPVNADQVAQAIVHISRVGEMNDSDLAYEVFDRITDKSK